MNERFSGWESSETFDAREHEFTADLSGTPELVHDSADGSYSEAAFETYVRHIQQSLDEGEVVVGRENLQCPDLPARGYVVMRQTGETVTRIWIAQDIQVLKKRRFIERWTKMHTQGEDAEDFLAVNEAGELVGEGSLPEMIAFARSELERCAE